MTSGTANDATSRCLAELERQVPALRRYARSLSRNADEADDLVQSCLVRALNRMATRPPAGDVRTWLFTILHNLHISRWRRFRRAAAVLVQGSAAEPALPASQDDHLALADVLRRLSRLPPEQREVLLLVAVEGLDYTEAASVLGIPLGTVMSRLSRARDRLHDGSERPAQRKGRPT